jgi:hypothetical protein
MHDATEIQLALRSKGIGNADPAQIPEQETEPQVRAMEMEHDIAGCKGEAFGDGSPSQVPELIDLGERKIPIRLSPATLGLGALPTALICFARWQAIKARMALECPPEIVGE